MGNSYRNFNSGRASGFTLAEMLVAVGMGVMLVVAAAGVFSLATQAVGSSQANTQINSKLRVLYSWLDRDFARIRLDGPLVLYPQEKNFGGGNTRIDQACFLISGDIPSMRTSNSASLAIILYGPDSITNNASLNDPYEWVFTRRGTLIVGDSTGGADIKQSSFAGLIANDVAGQAAWNAGWTKPDFYYDSASGRYLFTDATQLPTYLVGNVTSFKIIQYYMAGDTEPIEYDSTEWPAGTHMTFTPTDPKPAWIEFEIVLRDSNNRLQEGYTSRYRVNLPSR